MVGNIYLIYGDDEYIKNMKIKEIQKKYNVEDSINKIDLNGEEWEEIYDELTLPSFLSTNKIITIYQAETNIFNDRNEKDDLNLPSPYTFFEKILTNESYKNEILEDLAIIMVFDNKKISKKNKLKMEEKYEKNIFVIRNNVSWTYEGRNIKFSDNLLLL